MLIVKELLSQLVKHFEKKHVSWAEKIILLYKICYMYNLQLI
jgi:hypothetical protein